MKPRSVAWFARLNRVPSRGEPRSVAWSEIKVRVAASGRLRVSPIPLRILYKKKLYKKYALPTARKIFWFLIEERKKVGLISISETV
jgi:hypothetical protein